MGDVMHEKKKGGMSRRAFVGASAVAALTLASACSPENKLSETDDRKVYRLDTDLDEAVEGKWIPVSCWLNCGGACANYAYVVDNIIIRQKTDDWHPDTLEAMQQRSCVRGRSLRQWVNNANRIKYPMKRKGWEPGGGDKELRGVDEWERISWDEALDLVVSEIKRVYETYGPRSVLHSDQNAQYVQGLVNRLGGHVSTEFTDSFGTTCFNTNQMGLTLWGKDTGNDRLDMVNAETVVMYGCNVTWASPGSQTLNFMRAKQAGAEFVYVGPDYNTAASLFEAKWIQVRPGTDTAFLLSVAYVMITEDDPDTNPIIDWDFLDRCTVGFDSEHMPMSDQTTVNENFKDYVLGVYDGMPKTPEWASEISGTSIDDIRWYARKMAMTNKVMVLFSYAATRCNGAEDFPQLFMTIGAMGGHYGKSGHACGSMYHAYAGNDGPNLVKNGTIRSGEVVPNPIDDTIPSTYLWNSIVQGKYKYIGLINDYVKGGTNFVQPEERNLDIRMMWFEFGDFLNSRMDINNAIKAFRKVDFVLTQAIVFNANAQYSDIVLPVSSQWENDAFVPNYSYGVKNRDMQRFPQWAIKPLYESKSDRDIVYELASRLGIDPDEMFPYSEAQRLFDEAANATVLEADGALWSPLATITEADIQELGFDNPLQSGKIPIKDLLSRGLYVVERKSDDNYSHINFKPELFSHLSSSPFSAELTAIKHHPRNQRLVSDVIFYHTFGSNLK